MIVNHKSTEPSFKDTTLSKDIVKATFFHRNNFVAGLQSNAAKDITKLILNKIALNDELREYAFGEALDCFRRDAYLDSEVEILDKITPILTAKLL